MKRAWVILLLVLLALGLVLGLSSCSSPQARLKESLPAATPTPAPVEEETRETPAASGEARQSQWLQKSLAAPESETILEYRLYLPPKIEPEAAKYPLLLLLHGVDGGSEVWNDLGLAESLDRLIRDGSIPAMIVAVPSLPAVMDPTSQTAQGELIDFYTHLLASYPIRPEREAHAVGGYSIGATWAFYLAANYPEAWGRLGMHSQSMAYEAGYGLAEKMTASGLDFAIWMDIGQEDPALPAVTSLHQILEVSGLAHQFHVNPGGHSSGYWQEHLPEYLRWYAADW